MGAIGITPDCIDSGKGEDPSPLLFKHPGNQQTAELKRGSKIDFKNPVPLLIRYFKQVLMGTGRSIVDQNINPSKSLKRFFSDAFHFGPIRDVPDRDMSLGSQGLCFTCGLLTGIKVAASMDDRFIPSLASLRAMARPMFFPEPVMRAVRFGVMIILLV